MNHSAIDVVAKGVTLDRLAIVCKHSGSDSSPNCVWSPVPVSCRRSILQGGRSVFDCEATVQQCVSPGRAGSRNPLRSAIRSIWATPTTYWASRRRRTSRTPSFAAFSRKEADKFQILHDRRPGHHRIGMPRGRRWLDTIVIFGIKAQIEDVRIDHCDVLGKTSGLARYKLGQRGRAAICQPAGPRLSLETGQPMPRQSIRRRRPGLPLFAGNLGLAPAGDRSSQAGLFGVLAARRVGSDG